MLLLRKPFTSNRWFRDKETKAKDSKILEDKDLLVLEGKDRHVLVKSVVDFRLNLLLINRQVHSTNLLPVSMLCTASKCPTRIVAGRLPHLFVYHLLMSSILYPLFPSTVTFSHQWNPEVILRCLDL